MKAGEIWENDKLGYCVKIKRIEHKTYPTLYEWICNDEKTLIEPKSDCHIVTCRLVFSDYETSYLFDMFLRNFSKIYDENLLKALEEVREEIG